MGTRTIAVTLCAIVGGGAIPGRGASGPAQEITLFPRPKPPYSELFQVPAPRPAVDPPQPFIVVGHPGAVVVVTTPEPRRLTPRIVCGMKVIEGTADVDPGIVIPIPERHGAKIRTLGPAPCERAAPATPDRK